MGRVNMRALIDRLQRQGMASRAELAKLLGMSQPTAGKICDILLRMGVLEEVDPGEIERRFQSRAAGTASRIGRPGRMLRLDRSRPRFLAIELGVTRTSTALLPVGVDQVDCWSYSVSTGGSAAEWLSRLQAAASHMEQKKFWGILVSVPGIVDEAAGRVVFSANLHWTEEADLPGLIRNVWDAPVILVQEERALALGHRYFDPSAEDFLLVDVGDGVGGAIIVSGRLYATPLSISGELGHTRVLGNERPCGCGNIGCLETLLSIGGLLRSYAAACGREGVTWQKMAEHIAERGVEPWLAATLDAAGVVIAGALNVLGLRRVIITGSLRELAPPVMAHLASAIVHGAMWARFGEVEVESAPRCRMAGLVAVAIDRLVLPMADRGKNPNSSAAVAASYEAF